MTAAGSAGPFASDNGPSASDEARLTAVVTGPGSVFQAGRDQHIHLLDGISETRRTSDSSAHLCPYPGLAPFDRHYARWFFGRDRATADLVGAVSLLLGEGGMLAVVAPSGAGKSSLLQAGLLSALRRGVLPAPGSGDWPHLVLTPGATPMAALAAELATLLGDEPAQVRETFERDPERHLRSVRDAAGGDTARMVIVVDQMEELFTAAAAAERAVFLRWLSLLSTARPAAAAAAIVVIGLRADFYTQCIDHPPLLETLRHRQFLLAPMTEAELRAAVLFPAKAAGLQLEPGLVELLLRDLGLADVDSKSAYAVGRLPFLAHALQQSWQQRHGATLTVAGYQLTGGIHDAIATTAERAYARLDDIDKALAKRLLMRLVRVGDGMEDTRRRLDHDEILRSGPARTAAVLDTFTKERLLSQDRDTVEITHEALLRGWPRLRQWIDADRAEHLVHQDLEETAARWNSDPRRDSSLHFRGSRIDAAARIGIEPSPVAQAFLAASRRQQRRAISVRRGATAALAVLAVLTTVAAIVAAGRTREAARERDQAIFTKILAEAEQVSRTDVSLAAQLNLAAHRMRPTPQTWTRMLAAQNTPQSAVLTGHRYIVWSGEFRTDGSVFASASGDYSVRLWNFSNPVVPTLLADLDTGHTDEVFAVTFSQDGRLMATGSLDGTIRMWNVGDPAHPVAAGAPVPASPLGVGALLFSPSGNVLASGNRDGTIGLWQVAPSGRMIRLGRPLNGHREGVGALAFSPDGTVLASGSRDGTARLWNVAAPTRVRPAGRELTGHTSSVWSVAFSSDGRSLASGSGDGTIRLWNVSRPDSPSAIGRPLSGQVGAVGSVAFSPDGKTLASGGADSIVRLWNVADPAAPAPVGPRLTGHTGFVWNVRFSPDGRTLVSGSADATVRSWTLPATTRIGHAGAINAAAFSPDGQTVATAGADHTVRLWPMHGGPPKVLSGHTAAVHTVAFSPDGMTVASAGADQSVRLWPVLGGAPRVWSARSGAINSVAFSPDGRTLAAAGADHQVRLWSLPFGTAKVLSGHTAAVNAVAFSPDGQTLATASDDYALGLWNLSQPSPQQVPLPGHTTSVVSVAFSSDGRILASGSADSTVKLWPAGLGNSVATRSSLDGHTNTVRSVVLSRDRRTLISGSMDGTLRLWDITDPARASAWGEPIGDDSASVRALTLNADGTRFASGDDHGVLRLWSLDEAQSVRHVCAVPASLDRQAWDQHVSAHVDYRPPCGSHRSTG